MTMPAGLRISTWRWIAIFLLSVRLLSADDAPVSIRPFEEKLEDLHLLDPPWRSKTVYRESVIPLQFEEGGPITGRLAFPAKKIIQLRSADGRRTLEIGRDFQLSEDGLSVIFSPQPGLPYLRQSEFYPPPNSPNSYAHRVNHPEQWMLYSQGHWWHDRQYEVTYERSETTWSGTLPQLANQNLPRTFSLLKDRRPLKIGVSGDSITAGLNASGVTGASPYMPSYPGLVAAQLRATYGSEVSLENRAVPGWSIVHGIEDLDQLLKSRPDLMIVAYGMNDVGRRDPSWFRDQYQTFLKKLRGLSPETEVILVSTMIGNREWVHTPREMFDQYREVLLEFPGEGIAVADLTSVWGCLLQRKHDYDLTGNGLNHPNDCGNRLYSQVILSLLIPVQ